MELLTGKCKEKFEIYYIKFARKQDFIGDRYYDDTLINQFYQLPLAMQYGVIEDFFDNINIIINIQKKEKGNKWWVLRFSEKRYMKHLKTRDECRVNAIIKANEIYNQEI